MYFLHASVLLLLLYARYEQDDCDQFITVTLSVLELSGIQEIWLDDHHFNVM